MRLLDPDAYGLIAMALVLVGFANTFKRFGLSSALIQRKEVTPLQSSSVFWINVLVGGLLTSVLVGAAPFAVSFYGASPLLEPIIQALSCIFLFSAVGIVPQSLLRKDMEFKPIAKVRAASAGVAGPVAIAMAFAGYGVWSLVVKNLAETLMESALFLWYSSWRPRLRFSFAKTRALLRYGANLTGFKVINKFARAGDDLLIGRYMSAASLGLYSQAYKTMMVPIGKGIGAITNVLFPALSSIQDDEERVRRVYLKSVQAISFLIYPLMLGLLATSDHFVSAVLGQKWEGMVYILRVFCVVGLVQTLTKPTGWIYQSQGRADWMFRWGIFGAGTLIVAIVVGVVLGTIESVAWSYMIANVLLLYPGVTIPGWLINMSFGEVAKAISGNFLAAGFMAAGVFTLGRFLPGFWPVWVVLSTQVMTGIGLYWSLAYFFQMDAYRELVTILRERWDAVAHAG
jgi:PST family polysaccharide transporter